MSQSTNNQTEEGITFFGNKPAEVLAAFHASGLSAMGFSIVGRIVPHKAQLVGAGGENSHLFNGETRYAATFLRAAPAASTLN
ncbi:MAG: hypothetical protein ACU0CA_14020 [Paracoccaceae bacterium]